MERVRWFFDFLDTHNGVVTAFGTLIIALFTGFLAIATIELKKLGEQQAHDVTESLKVSRDAAKAAKDSADAARDTVRLAEENTERQLRAYLGAGPLTAFSFDFSPSRRHGFHVHLLNTGQTPAYRVRFVGKMKVLPPIAPDTNLHMTDPINFSEGEGTEVYFIAAGAQGGSRGHVRMEESLQPSELDEILANPKERRVYVWARAEYFDVFKKRRTFTLCFAVASVGKPGFKFADLRVENYSGFIPDVVGSEQCRLGNDAD